MTGNEFLHEVSRERLEQIVKLYCCPEDVNIKTKYSCDENTCCDDYMGDCTACWSSKVIEE